MVNKDKLLCEVMHEYEKAEESYKRLKDALMVSDDDDDYPSELAYADGYRHAAFMQWVTVSKAFAETEDKLFE